MIAEITIANELPLYTNNPADFRGIEELEVVAVVVHDLPEEWPPPVPRLGIQMDAPPG